MQHYSLRVLALCLLALLFAVHQSSSAPALTLESSSGLQQSDTISALHRTARMSPLWRILASKPHGAYCLDHMECSTRLCRNGFCSFDEPVHS